MKKEEDDAEAEQTSKRKVRDELLISVLKYVVVAALAASGWVLK